MSLVLTNDDGVHSEGLRALRDAVGGAAAAIVAPAEHHSGCSHRVTTHPTPIRVEELDTDVFAVHGTPADCARIGLRHLRPGTAWVLSGINFGGNLGADIYHSGTVAAVREAAYLGVPGIAISQFIRPGVALDWTQSGAWTAHVLNDLMNEPPPARTFYNVNLPHLEPGAPVPEIVHCDPCRMPLPVDFHVDGDAYVYRGVYADRERDPGADVDRCFSGAITVSLIPL